jgi:hypothetical protein
MLFSREGGHAQSTPAASEQPGCWAADAVQRHEPRLPSSGRATRNALFLLAACLTSATTLGRDPPTPTPADATAAPVDPVPLGETPLEREKRRKALAGLAAVAGIAIVGIGLVAVIILWGGRLRRINREPLPDAKPRNEFWFLQPPKPPVSERGPESDG